MFRQKLYAMIVFTTTAHQFSDLSHILLFTSAQRDSSVLVSSIEGVGGLK